MTTSSDGFDDTPDWEALARFRAGESTPAEAERVSRWLERHPDDASALDAIDVAVVAHLAPATTAAPVDVERGLSRVHQRMDDASVATPRLRRGMMRHARWATSPRWSTGWTLGGLAAAAVIGAMFFTLRRPDPPSTGGAVASTASARRVYTTAVGALDTVNLGDGTRVLLGPASRLTVSPTFGAGARDVTLDGIARFAVRHDTGAPFTVHAGRALVRDVGTRFVVRAPHDSTLGVSVSVAEGEVTLGAAGMASAPTPLRQGDRAVLDLRGAVLAERGVTAEDDEAWTRGALVFRDAPLAVVRDEVRRWYGIELRVDDAAVSARRLTATFDHVTADQALRTIALALGATLDRSGSVATLRARPLAP